MLFENSGRYSKVKKSGKSKMVTYFAVIKLLPCFSRHLSAGSKFRVIKTFHLIIIQNNR